MSTLVAVVFSDEVYNSSPLPGKKNNYFGPTSPLRKTS